MPLPTEKFWVAHWRTPVECYLFYDAERRIWRAIDENGEMVNLELYLDATITDRPPLPSWVFMDRTACIYAMINDLVFQISFEKKWFTSFDRSSVEAMERAIVKLRGELCVPNP